MSVVINGSAGVTTNSGAVYNGLQTGTAVASTSSSTISFTNIPSWVKRITIMCHVVSTNGTSNIEVRLGSGGSLLATGYIGYSDIAYTSTAIQRSTTGFPMYYDTASFQISGNMVFTNVSGNTWICSGVGSNSGGSPTFGWYSNGYVTLSGTLNIIGVSTGNGTDTFDSGTINILYE